MILLNISQNVAIYLFKYFVSHIIVVPRKDTFLHERTDQISACYKILWNAFLLPE